MCLANSGLRYIAKGLDVKEKFIFSRRKIITKASGKKQQGT